MFDPATTASVTHCLGEVVMDKVQRQEQHAGGLLPWRDLLSDIGAHCRPPAVHHRPRKSTDRAASA